MPDTAAEPRWGPCPYCNGKGRVKPYEITPCPNCEGLGVIELPRIEE